MTTQFPTLALLALAVALFAMVILAWRNHRRADALAQLLRTANQEMGSRYAMGHADGLQLGLARGLGEGEQSAAKHFQNGYDQALADLDQQDEVAAGGLATCA